MFFFFGFFCFFVLIFSAVKPCAGTAQQMEVVGTMLSGHFLWKEWLAAHFSPWQVKEGRIVVAGCQLTQGGQLMKCEQGRGTGSHSDIEMTQAAAGRRRHSACVGTSEEPETEKQLPFFFFLLSLNFMAFIKLMCINYFSPAENAHVEPFGWHAACTRFSNAQPPFSTNVIVTT